MAASATTLNATNATNTSAIPTMEPIQAPTAVPVPEPTSMPTAFSERGFRKCETWADGSGCYTAAIDCNSTSPEDLTVVCTGAEAADLDEIYNMIAHADLYAQTR